MIQNRYNLDKDGFIRDEYEASSWLLKNSLNYHEADVQMVHCPDGSLYCNIRKFLTIVTSEERLMVNIKYASGLTIYDSPNLKTLYGMPNEIDIYGFNISNCPGLRTLEYLPKLNILLNPTQFLMKFSMLNLITYQYSYMCYVSNKNIYDLLEFRKKVTEVYQDPQAFINWLPYSPNRERSLQWLSEVDLPFYQKLLEYCIENKINNVFSMDVLNIAKITLNVNHRI